MFFKKKKQKLDSKVRFQNRQFNQKLQEARTFKRSVKPIPDGEFSKFLKKIGLGSAWRQVGFALLVLIVLYLIYFPNFLTLKEIEIEGVRDSNSAEIEASIRDNISKVPFYNPQRNILFLSKTRLESILNEFATVDAVNSITKDFKNKRIRIVVTPKQEQFLVRSTDHTFVLYNDGSLKTEADRSLWDTNQNTHLIKVDVPAHINVVNAREFLFPETVSYLTKLEKELKGIVGSPLAFINIPITESKKAQVMEPAPTDAVEVVDEVTTEEDVAVEVPPPVPEELPVVDIHTPITADELNVFLQKGDQKERLFQVLLDPKEDTNKSVQRLNLLLSQTAADRYINLSYIDLRIGNRAYVCLTNTVCAK